MWNFSGIVFKWRPTRCYKQLRGKSFRNRGRLFSLWRAALLALIHARLWTSCIPTQKTVIRSIHLEDEFERKHAIELMQSAPGYMQFSEAYKALRPNEYLSKNLGSYILAYSTNAGPKIHFFKTENARGMRLTTLMDTGYQNKDFVDRALTDYFLKNLKQNVPAGSHHSVNLKVLNSKIYALYYKLEKATKATFNWFRSH